jgi:hypothetical protein
MATTDVRKTLTDTGYIAIGLGVMGFQQAQVRGRKLRTRLAGTGDCLSARTREAQQKFETRSRNARTRAEEQMRTTVARAHELRGEVEKRVEPVVGQVQTQLVELPERVVQAMEPVAARVRELTGNAA